MTEYERLILIAEARVARQQEWSPALRLDGWTRPKPNQHWLVCDTTSAS
jgi:hypothetical protein